jgi:hypothetical protein
VLSGRGLCDELITRLEEYYRLWYVVVCDLETSRIGAPHIYDINNLRVKWKYVGSGQRTLASVEGVNPVRESCGFGCASNGDKLIKI